MKKRILSSTLAAGLVISVGLSSSAFAANHDVKAQNKITVVDSKIGTVDSEPQWMVKAAGSAVKNAWNAIPAGDRYMVTEAIQRMIGLGGVQKDQNFDNEDLEYLFDK